MLTDNVIHIIRVKIPKYVQRVFLLYVRRGYVKNGYVKKH